MIIEAGQLDAFGVVVAEEGAKEPSKDSAGAVTLRASAQVDGVEVAHEVNSLGSIKLDPAPKLRVVIAPTEGGAKPVNAPSDEPLEFTIEPGRTITLKVRVERLGFKGQVPFGNEGAGRNLPFGAIVDNLGLNGLLVLDGQQERTFFVTADRSTPEQTPAVPPHHGRGRGRLQPADPPASHRSPA